MELEIFYDYRTDAWHWTGTGEERVGDLGTRSGKGMGVQGPFLTASLAIRSARHIHPGIPWVKGVLEHYSMYLDGARRFQAGNK